MSNHSDDSDSEDATSKLRRPSGACAHCKSLKVKCEFQPGQQTCRRCTTGNHDCVVRGRKKRKPAPTHEDLQKRFHKQDLQIQSLLHDLDKMKFEEKIRQWSERPEFSKHITSTPPYDGPELSPAPYRYSQDDVQVVNTLRARSRAKNEERAAQDWRRGIPELAPPDIITYAVVAPEEIVVLFQIFFDRINPFFSLLDPDLHTPARLIWASPFLFTVICAVASRFYTAKPNLYGMAMEFAREAAGKALVDEVKSIDVCQAYVLLGVYPMPAKKWAKDRSWLFMGVGIRMALELGLHHHPPAALPERERLNRTRTWLNLFCVDGAHATMFGKQPMSSLNDVVSRSSFNWYKASALTLPYDIHLCGYVDILYIMTRFRDAVGHDPTEKAGQDLDITATCLHYEEELAKKMAFWSQRYAEDRNNSDPLCNYRGNTTRLITAYLRLVVLSLGFPFAVKKGVMRDSPIVQKCIDVAFLVIHIIVRDLYPTGILRFAMESNFLYVAFAASFLLNLLRPKLVPLLDLATHRRIITVVRDLIRVLGSKEVVWDGRHTPALYSKFLSALLDKYDHPQVQIDTDGSLEFTPHFRQDRQQTPPNIYSWPDTPSTNVLIHDEAIERPIGTIYQTSGDADMDFSLQYFMQTTQAQSLNSTAPDSQIPALAASSLMEPDGWGGFNHTQWAPEGFYPTYRR